MSAIISPCGHYRYRIDRTVGMNGPVYAFFGINPSTADASLDDATVRKWIGFTKVWGGSRFIVGNVFAYRSTDVKKLAGVEDPYGDDIGEYISDIIEEADMVLYLKTRQAHPEYGVILSALHALKQDEDSVPVIAPMLFRPDLLRFESVE